MSNKLCSARISFATFVSKFLDRKEKIKTFATIPTEIRIQYLLKVNFIIIIIASVLK